MFGTISLRDICNNREEFGNQVQQKASVDMRNLGIEIISCNIQTIEDENDLIKNMGMDNTAKIRKDAAIAKAEADRDVKIKQAEADKEANAARVKADLEIAQKQNELEIRKSELKKAADTKAAEAEAAFEIQKQQQRKTIEEESVNADIARKEREVELEARKVEIQERALEAGIKKKAEAEKFAKQQEADAKLYIRTKEAEAIDKKAEAMKKYGEAAILEMALNVLPEIAKNVAEPISSIDKVTVIGGDSKGVSDIANNVPILMAKTIESVKEATGIDLKEIIKAETFEGKTTRNFNITAKESDEEIKLNEEE